MPDLHLVSTPTRSCAMSRTLVLTIFVLTQLHSNLPAQTWTQVFDFKDGIRSVFFSQLTELPTLGFVGTADGSIWRTSDGGTIWAKTGLADSYVTNFTFKDATTGWASVRDARSGKSNVMRTRDGGLTWEKLPRSGAALSIHYAPGSQRLFLSDQLDGVVVSSDDGTSWTQIDFKVHNGYAFSDLEHGVIAENDQDGMLLTSDGGITWQKFARPETVDEAWQPAAIPGSSKFFLMCELSGSFYRSTDYGANWLKTNQFPAHQQNGDFMTGDLHFGECVLYAQSSQSGVYLSSNEGQDWQKIQGPSNILDSRMATHHNTAFAGDDRGVLWSFDASPRLPSPNLLQLNPGNKRTKANWDDEVSVRMTFTETIPGDSPLDSVYIVTGYDHDVLTRTSITTGPAWLLVGSVTDFNGMAAFTVKRIDRRDILAGETVATMSFRTTISANPYSDIWFVERRFNEGNSICDVQQLVGDTTRVEMNYACGDSLFLKYFRGNSLLTLISVSPNPAMAGAESTQPMLNLVAEHGMELEVEVVDMTGMPHLVRQSMWYEAGHHSIPLGVHQSGAYLVRVRSSDLERSIKFVIQ